MSKLLLPLFVAVGYATQTNVQVIKDTKAWATKTCKNGNYTSQLGDVNMNCTLN